MTKADWNKFADNYKSVAGHAESVAEVQFREKPPADWNGTTVFLETHNVTRYQVIVRAFYRDRNDKQKTKDITLAATEFHKG